MPAERSFHKTEFLFQLPEEMIRHNSHSTNINWSSSRCAQASIKYGEAMATAAIHCSSPSSRAATLELHAGRLTGNGLLSITTQGRMVRSIWSILKVVTFTPSLPGTTKIAYRVGHATARQSTLLP